MWEEGVRIYDTPGVPNNFPKIIREEDKNKKFISNFFI